MNKKVNFEESKKEKKIKKGISKVIVLVFFIGLLIGLGGAVCLYEFTDFRKEKSEIKTTDKDQNKDVEENETSKEGNDDKPGRLNSKELKELTDLIDKLYYIDFYNSDINDINKQLDSQELMWIAISIMDVDLFEEDIDCDDIIDILDDLLIEYNLEFEDLYDWNCNIPIYKYDSDKNVLVVNEEHAGHGSGYFETEVVNRYIESSQAGNEYTISVYKLFGEVNDFLPPTSFYATYDDAFEKSNPVVEYDVRDLDDDFYHELEKNMLNILNKEDNEEKLIKHTYVFVCVDNNYKLKTYKIG